MAIELQTATSFAAPTVEWLAVRLVVDSYYDRFVADAEHPAVRIEHTRHIPGHERSTLAGEWGLSLHLESRGAVGSAQYLLDFGFTPEILNRNFALLGLEAGALDGLILSHGHLDHYGGLLGFLAQHRPQMRKDVKLFAGGAANFDEKWIKRRDGVVVSWGRLDRGAIERARVEPVCCEEARALAGPFTSGQIGRTSFERMLENTFVAPSGPAAREHFSEAELAGRLVPDQHPDEHATAYLVQGRGLVVVSSCGHAGILNTVRTAMAVSGVQKLHAVIGGFHLGPAPMDYVDHTVAELKALDPDVVIPMHCSGTKFQAAMRAAMPEKLVLANTGSRFVFGV